MNLKNLPSHYRLEHQGIKNVGTIYWNPPTPILYEEIVRRREGVMAHLGPMVVRTGHHTGRSPNDKRIVREKTSEKKIWWSPVNVPMEPEKFEVLYFRMLAYLQGKDVFVQDCFAGADPKYQVPIRIITESAWHNLFSRNMFVQAKNRSELAHHLPKFTIINVPKFHAMPEMDGTNSESFIIVNFGKRLILIGGTSYAGEIKKSVFTVLNYLYPQEKVLSMHCSANVGEKGDVAIFFGLSGTGKTTLSADVERLLIGDDEHGWSDKGIFNFEGGCYAKVIRLSPEAEPEIYECTRRFGTILENVGIDTETRRIDLNDGSLTENTRAAYPISHIARAVRSGVAGHPRNIIMLTYDAFGVLPPIAKLSPEQAMYQFLSGYTAKVAGTEKGLGKEPQATFSTCFGAPFMALPPTVYAGLLGERIKSHKVKCWLVNTGLSGGPFGVGGRIKIAYTRAMIHQALAGKLDDVPTQTDPIFRLDIPQYCNGVPEEILEPRSTWRLPREYDVKARDLAARFRENFKQFSSKVSARIKNAGPGDSY
ncbi:MAG: phosphoenolpyruvate carboxykinase (ATP) [Deltaproteobacteria bacterium]|nr:phosphoenolpyruvate carboxykinase (ATP) [Deltaproteobacteria bacterium]